MSSRSSNRRGERRISLGRVAGHRGRAGEITIRGCGQAEAWLAVRRVRIGRPPEGGEFEVEHARAYRDRLVLKLVGVDDAGRAAGLRGMEVQVRSGDAPQLPEGVHYVDALVGLTVQDESGRELGRVERIIETGGADLLGVKRGGLGYGPDEEGNEAAELLIPIAGDFVRSIDEDAGRIVVRVPRELLELNP